MTAYFTIGFSAEERVELLELFKNNFKWKNRIENSYGFLMSDNLPNSLSNFQCQSWATPENKTK